MTTIEETPAVDLPEVSVTSEEVSIRWPERPGHDVVTRCGVRREVLAEPPLAVRLEAPKEHAR